MDRNVEVELHMWRKSPSLSARRAWIEMLKMRLKLMKNRVALRKESVDRNADGAVSGSGDYGRSPQGERG